MGNNIKIYLENVSKVFGPDALNALALIDKGMTKTELLEKKGHVLGLHGINLEIETGKTTVIMGAVRLRKINSYSASKSPD